MPKPGDAITEAILADIHVADGDAVAEGDLLYTLETEKVSLDVDAPAAGTVRWKVAVGGTYETGELLAVID